MSDAINSQEIYTVKALQAAGVPLPFWSVTGNPPPGLRRWPHKRERSFQPYGPHIIQSYAMTKFLIEKGVDVNTRLVVDRDWVPPGIGMDVTMTPLHVALTDGRVETARLLIAHGADVHARDSIGRSPLTVAITLCPSAIELLLDSGVNINEQTRFGSPLLVAARYQWLYPGLPLRQVRDNAVKILLEKGADPNTRDSDGRNALMVMSMEHRPDSELFGLIAPPPPPPPPAPAGSVPAIIDRLRGAHRRGAGGVIYGTMGAQYVSLAPDAAYQVIGETLLQAGCDINATDSNGRTPLMYAVRYQRPAAVQLLLERGANENMKDKGGLTALDLAKQSGNKEIIHGFIGPDAYPRPAKSKTVK